MASFNIRAAIANQKCNDVNETTIAYIESLLTPYISILDGIEDEESFLNWVEQNLDEDALMDLRHDMKVNRKAGTPITAEFFRHSILDSMIADIMRPYWHHDIITSIFPWDIQQHFPERLLGLFSVARGYTTFPITIMMADRALEYEMTLDQTIGVFLFAEAFKARTGQDNLQIIVCGTRFTYFENPKTQYRWAVRDHYSFFPCLRIQIADQEYQFQSSELMQGFVLGALLTNQDHHEYWSNLRRMKDATTSEPIQF